ncbi:MAG: flagellar filament capping protein FliD, partial [Planctomycetes bacterium]|nr:flagellar filament capping protein FliD [Planctomycetota bacterium]
GVSSGSIKITNSQGLFREVDLTSAKTLQDVIGAINTTNIGVTARINDNGDGLLLEDSSHGSWVMSIAEVGGSAARDLNILGQAQNGRIDGSFELRIDVSAGQSLQDLVNRVNQDAGAPVSASILNDGTATAPYRLQLNARNSGSTGEVLIDAGTTGLDFATLSRAQDARVVLGGSEGGVMVVSSTNTIRNIVPGLSLTLSGVSDQPVTVTVSQDHAASKEALSGLVEDFNAAIDRIRELSGYDSETDERGILLGDSTTNNIESRLLRTMTGALPGGAGAIRRWGQIGISIKNGHLEFDEAKFDAAYERNPDGVIDLFTRAETGVAASLKKTLESLSESGTGMIARRTGALDSQSDDLKDRIAELNDLLDRKRERLMRQYQAMEQVLSQLQSQGSTLSQIASLSQSTR